MKSRSPSRPLLAAAIIVIPIAVLILGVLHGLLGHWTDSILHEADVALRKMKPEKYWKQQIDKLQQSIKSQEFLIEDLSLEIAKKSFSIAFEVSQEVNIATHLGLDPNQAAERAAARAESEISALQDQIVSLEKSIEKAKIEFDQANKELLRCK